MKKIICLAVMSVFLVSCTSFYDRSLRIKERGRTVSEVQISGDVSYAKELSRKIGSGMGLIEDVGIEGDNFMFLTTRFKRSDIICLIGSIFFSGLARNDLGLFFEYDMFTKKTAITITEATALFARPKRYELSEQLKARQGEKIGDGAGFGDMGGFGKKKSKKEKDK